MRGPVCIIGGHTPSLTNFRGPLLRAIKGRGYDVIAVGGGRDEAVSAALTQDGIRFEPMPLARAGLNPLKDLNYYHALRHLMRRERPAVVLSYTHKPVVYSSLACARAHSSARVYGLITGLGFAFVGGDTFRRRVAREALTGLYRLASRSWAGVVFQNPDDEQFFKAAGLMPPSTPRLVVRGSGVDLRHYSAEPLPTTAPRFLLIARLLVDKGIREYVAAAREVRRSYPLAEFYLAGPLDTNPASITAAELRAWEEEGVVQYQGAVADVRPLLRACTAFVLPSAYGEGTPRTILEAMATGRPVITTDAPGCRETVFGAVTKDGDGVAEGDNGILVPPRSASALALAMLRLAGDDKKIRRMADESRRFAEEHYDVNLVNQQMLDFMGL